MRAYHRIDPLMDERKGHYTPAQFATFLKVQLVAGRQTNRGRFRSLAALRGTLPAAYARHLDFLVAEGDLLILEDQSVYVDGWDEWQEGDFTVRDRMSRLRDRKRNGTVTGTVTRPSPTAIRTSEGVGVGVGGAKGSSPRDWDDDRPDLEMFLLLTRRAPSPRQRKLLDDLLLRHDVTGPQWAADMMAQQPDDPIGAVIEADRQWTAMRLAEAKKAETPKPRRRRGQSVPQSTRELLAHWAASAAESRQSSSE